MMGVVDRGVHADLCQYDVCVDQEDVETSEINSPAKTPDNDPAVTVKRYPAIAYKVKLEMEICKIIICVAVMWRALNRKIGTN